MEQKYAFPKIQQAKYRLIKPSNKFQPVHCLCTPSSLLHLFFNSCSSPPPGPVTLLPVFNSPPPLPSHHILLSLPSLLPLLYPQLLLFTATFILLSALLLLLLPLLLSHYPFCLSFPHPSYSSCLFCYYTSSLRSLQALLHITSPSTPSRSPTNRPTRNVTSPSRRPKTVPLPLQVHPVLPHLLLILLQPLRHAAHPTCLFLFNFTLDSLFSILSLSVFFFFASRVKIKRKGRTTEVH